MSFPSYSNSLLRFPQLGFSLDFSLMDIPSSFHDEMSAHIAKAFADIEALEAGAVANRDEQRMVGHYWLRNPDLAPNEQIRRAITEPLAALRTFAADVESGRCAPPSGGRFENLLVIGIGGSALGPQLVYDALLPNARMRSFFLDNTDPDGFDRTLAAIPDLSRTLTLVISKSGGTPETRNGMIEARAAYQRASLEFPQHAVAITGEDSPLATAATAEKWRARFPMEDWIGGRTSVTSTVGLVPMALQGLDIDAFLAGAAAMDELTRLPVAARNPAMQLALAWYHEGNGRGERDMVVLPYKDSLLLFSRYLQQLVMESLGKRLDLDGRVVHQGLAVYGNKGSTDQHAYVQQLRDGLHNFFVTFIEVRQERSGDPLEVESGVTSGDYLQGFLRGTRKALHEAGRRSLTISLPEVTPHSLGALIALFERAVSFYASLVNINAYHQPGVEAGKRAANDFLDLLRRVENVLTSSPQTAEALAKTLSPDPEDVYHALVHLAANRRAQITAGDSPAADTFRT